LCAPVVLFFFFFPTSTGLLPVTCREKRELILRAAVLLNPFSPPINRARSSHSYFMLVGRNRAICGKAVSKTTKMSMGIDRLMARKVLYMGTSRYL
jgi:hypothetical protein